MQKTYEPKLWKTLQKNPKLIIDGLAWSEHYQLIVSKSRQSKNGKLEISDINRDLIHIPYNNGSETNKAVNPVAELLMIEAHRTCGHGAARATLSSFRTKYWVRKGNKLSTWAKKLCPKCKRIDVKTVVAPTAPLPEFRHVRHRPFESVGIDFLGPLPKLHDTKQKTYIVVFSCTYTRAIILKPITTVSAEAFAAVFNTVRHEYGIEPTTIVSDQAQTFKCVYTRTLIDQKEYLEAEFPRILWRFNAARAPWWGGFFERMMAIIKDKLARCFILTKSIYKNFYRFQEAVAYAQDVINSRPMTWMSQANDETRHPICPAIFLNFYSRYNFHKLNPYQ